MENHFVSAGGLSACLILIPAIILVISTAYVTNIMDCVIYSFLNVFLIVTYVIALISVPIIIVLSASIGGWTLYYYGIFVGSVRRATRLGSYPCTRIYRHNVFTDRSLRSDVCPYITFLSLDHVPTITHFHMSYQINHVQVSMSTHAIVCTLNV
jgi:hypothetical protein